jgi:hypothetical protein
MTQSEARQPQNGQPQDGQPQDGQPQGGQPQGGRQQQNGTRQQDGRQAGRQPGDPIGTDRANARPDGLGGFQRLIDEVSPRAGGPYYPLTGPDYREWSDRLRDVEEMVADPELRAEAARIRERARSVRLDMTRHSQPPNWDLVRMQIAKPLNELANRLTEELLKRTAKDALVPIDRDPVPPKYEEQVRRYYENLGRGQ